MGLQRDMYAMVGSKPVAPSNGATPIPDELPRFSPRETLFTMAGVLLVMLLASLDQTIVGTALPRMIADLKGFHEYTWVSTAYLLTSTIVVPIYGKLSDLFGRKPILIIGVVLFLVGSVLSGAAQSMVQLILFRGFQGIGAGALLPIALTVVGDLFTPRERGKWQGVTGAVFGLASILGPMFGGWITDTWTWRWIFYVNLPTGIVALMVLIYVMPRLRAKNHHVKIDVVGCALMALGTVPILLGLTWAGTFSPWMSWQVQSQVIGGLVILSLFFAYEARLERKQAQPLLEPSLFRKSIFAVSLVATTLFGMGLFGCVAFLPPFLQAVVGDTATNSGVLLMPLMLTAAVASMAAGQLVSRLGRYKWVAVGSMALNVVGTYLLFRLDVHANWLDVVIAMLVLGPGMGVSMSLYPLVVQNALPQKIGQATSALTFFRQIGATIGLAVMGSLMVSTFPQVFQSALPTAVKNILPAGVLSQLSDPSRLLSPVTASSSSFLSSHTPQTLAASQQLVEATKLALAQSLHTVFTLCLCLMIAGLLTVVSLKEIPLRGTTPGKE